MRAIDIYALTRDIPVELRAQFEKNMSRRDTRLRIKAQEFAQIKAIVEELQAIGATKESFEDWFYSFTIPHISREFDLLKVGKNECVVNLELKTSSPSVTLPRIKKQLERNAYYLSLIAKKIHSFTYLSDGKGKGQLYTLKAGCLKKCTFRELAGKLGKIRTPVQEGIEEMFHPGEFLISPFSEPERFCAEQYFLTEHQQQMKERILSGIRRSRSLLWGITGEAGTGKTLLLYDIAKALSGVYSIGVIHCGKLTEGHQKLREMLFGVDIFEADVAEGSPHTVEETGRTDRFAGYDIVCVDETQRLRGEELREIIQAYETGRIKACIFIYDLKQVLSRTEREQNNPAKLRALQGFTELSLTKTIRTSKEIYAFINVMLDLKKRSNCDFAGIDVLWAGNARERDWILKGYLERGYRFISMPVLEGEKEGFQEFGAEPYENSHDVIGLEFDAVTVVLDQRFHYDASGVLVGIQAPDEDALYVQMLYQNVSRAKERLCVIVQENEGVFRELVRVLE